ncbi:MAG: carcinine hydrolase/isopenicillin-N N-acyltransferase family protein [Parvibaculaceae bacterium]
MCDTMVARPGASANGGLVFAKNSDREANEAQAIVYVPAAAHEAGAPLRCTYIDVPQVARTHGVLLSKPYWMWGAEMGANDQGLVIGNEAVFAKLPPPADPALIGMDLLRLALERAASVDEAIEVIATLLATHGQGGNCGHTTSFTYHNAFLIADAAGDAVVMETVGRDWAVERVDAIRSISNTYTIGTEIHGESKGLRGKAAELGWKEGKAPFNLAEIFSDRTRSRFATGHERWCRTTGLLTPKAGTIDAPAMMAVLRDHGPRAARDPDWHPDGVLGGSVCAHASWGPVRRFGQTTGSWITEFRDGRPVHWITGTSAPDTGIFKPVFFGPGWDGADLPDFGPLPGGRYDEKTLWWRHERLHRAVLEDYAPRLTAYAADRDALEARFRQEVEHFLTTDGTPHEAGILAARAWKAAALAEDQWLGKVLAVPPRRKHRPSAFYRMHWKRLNRAAAFSAQK